MAKTPASRAVVTDPVHRILDFGTDRKFKEALKSLVDSICFQRLRRISQLGLASYVYPGATHTRFSHSLGAAYLAHAVLTHLRERADKKEDQEEINHVFNQVMMAA